MVLILRFWPVFLATVAVFGITTLPSVEVIRSEKESSELVTTEWYFQSLNVQLYFGEFSSNTMETA